MEEARPTPSPLAPSSPARSLPRPLSPARIPFPPGSGAASRSPATSSSLASASAHPSAPSSAARSPPWPQSPARIPLLPSPGAASRSPSASSAFASAPTHPSAPSSGVQSPQRAASPARIPLPPSSDTASRSPATSSSFASAPTRPSASSSLHSPQRSASPARIPPPPSSGLVLRSLPTSSSFVSAPTRPSASAAGLLSPQRSASPERIPLPPSSGIASRSPAASSSFASAPTRHSANPSAAHSASTSGSLSPSSSPANRVRSSAFFDAPAPSPSASLDRIRSSDRPPVRSPPRSPARPPAYSPMRSPTRSPKTSPSLWRRSPSPLSQHHEPTTRMPGFSPALSEEWNMASTIGPASAVDAREERRAWARILPPPTPVLAPIPQSSAGHGTDASASASARSPANAAGPATPSSSERPVHSIPSSSSRPYSAAKSHEWHPRTPSPERSTPSPSSSLRLQQLISRFEQPVGEQHTRSVGLTPRMEQPSIPGSPGTVEGFQILLPPGRDPGSMLRQIMLEVFEFSPHPSHAAYPGWAAATATLFSQYLVLSHRPVQTATEHMILPLADMVSIAAGRTSRVPTTSLARYRYPLSIALRQDQVLLSFFTAEERVLFNIELDSQAREQGGLGSRPSQLPRRLQTRPAPATGLGQDSTAGITQVPSIARSNTTPSPMTSEEDSLGSSPRPALRRGHSARVPASTMGMPPLGEVGSTMRAPQTAFEPASEMGLSLPSEQDISPTSVPRTALATGSTMGMPSFQNPSPRRAPASAAPTGSMMSIPTITDEGEKPAPIMPTHGESETVLSLRSLPHVDEKQTLPLTMTGPTSAMGGTYILEHTETAGSMLESPEGPETFITGSELPDASAPSLEAVTAPIDKSDMGAPAVLEDKGEWTPRAETLPLAGSDLGAPTAFDDPKPRLAPRAETVFNMGSDMGAPTALDDLKTHQSPHAETTSVMGSDMGAPTTLEDARPTYIPRAAGTVVAATSTLGMPTVIEDDESKWTPRAPETPLATGSAMGAPTALGDPGSQWAPGSPVGTYLGTSLLGANVPTELGSLGQVAPHSVLSSSSSLGASAVPASPVRPSSAHPETVLQPSTEVELALPDEPLAERPPSQIVTAVGAPSDVQGPMVPTVDLARTPSQIATALDAPSILTGLRQLEPLESKGPATELSLRTRSELGTLLAGSRIGETVAPRAQSDLGIPIPNAPSSIGMPSVEERAPTAPRLAPHKPPSSAAWTAADLPDVPTTLRAPSPDSDQTIRGPIGIPRTEVAPPPLQPQAAMRSVNLSHYSFLTPHFDPESDVDVPVPTLAVESVADHEARPREGFDQAAHLRAEANLGPRSDLRSEPLVSIQPRFALVPHPPEEPDVPAGLQPQTNTGDLRHREQNLSQIEPVISLGDAAPRHHASVDDTLEMPQIVTDVPHVVDTRSEVPLGDIPPLREGTSARAPTQLIQTLPEALHEIPEAHQEMFMGDVPAVEANQPVISMGDAPRWEERQTSETRPVTQLSHHLPQGEQPAMVMGDAPRREERQTSETHPDAHQSHQLPRLHLSHHSHHEQPKMAMGDVPDGLHSHTGQPEIVMGDAPKAQEQNLAGETPVVPEARMAAPSHVQTERMTGDDWSGQPYGGAKPRIPSIAPPAASIAHPSAAYGSRQALPPPPPGVLASPRSALSFASTDLSPDDSASQLGGQFRIPLSERMSRRRPYYSTVEPPVEQPVEIQPVPMPTPEEIAEGAPQPAGQEEIGTMAEPRLSQALQGEAPRPQSTLMHMPEPPSGGQPIRPRTVYDPPSQAQPPLLPSIEDARSTYRPYSSYPDDPAFVPSGPQPEMQMPSAPIEPGTGPDAVYAQDFGDPVRPPSVHTVGQSPGAMRPLGVPSVVHEEREEEPPHRPPSAVGIHVPSMERDQPPAPEAPQLQPWDFPHDNPEFLSSYPQQSPSAYGTAPPGPSSAAPSADRPIQSKSPPPMPASVAGDTRPASHAPAHATAPPITPRVTPAGVYETAPLATEFEAAPAPPSIAPAQSHAGGDAEALGLDPYSMRDEAGAPATERLAPYHGLPSNHPPGENGTPRSFHPGLTSPPGTQGEADSALPASGEDRGIASPESVGNDGAEHDPGHRSISNPSLKQDPSATSGGEAGKDAASEPGEDGARGISIPQGESDEVQGKPAEDKGVDISPRAASPPAASAPAAAPEQDEESNPKEWWPETMRQLAGTGQFRLADDMDDDERARFFGPPGPRQIAYLPGLTPPELKKRELAPEEADKPPSDQADKETKQPGSPAGSGAPLDASRDADLPATVAPSKSQKSVSAPSVSQAPPSRAVSKPQSSEPDSGKAGSKPPSAGGEDETRSLPQSELGEAGPKPASTVGDIPEDKSGHQDNADAHGEEAEPDSAPAPSDTAVPEEGGGGGEGPVLSGSRSIDLPQTGGSQAPASPGQSNSPHRPGEGKSHYATAPHTPSSDYGTVPGGSPEQAGEGDPEEHWLPDVPANPSPASGDDHTQLPYHGSVAPSSRTKPPPVAGSSTQKPLSAIAEDADSHADDSSVPPGSDGEEDRDLPASQQAANTSHGGARDIAMPDSQEDAPASVGGKSALVGHQSTSRSPPASEATSFKTAPLPRGAGTELVEESQPGPKATSHPTSVQGSGAGSTRSKVAQAKARFEAIAQSAPASSKPGSGAGSTGKPGSVAVSAKSLSKSPLVAASSKPASRPASVAMSSRSLGKSGSVFDAPKSVGKPTAPGTSVYATPPIGPPDAPVTVQADQQHSGPSATVQDAAHGSVAPKTGSLAAGPAAETGTNDRSVQPSTDPSSQPANRYEALAKKHGEQYGDLINVLRDVNHWLSEDAPRRAEEWRRLAQTIEDLNHGFSNMPDKTAQEISRQLATAAHSATRKATSAAASEASANERLSRRSLPASPVLGSASHVSPKPSVKAPPFSIKAAEPLVKTSLPSVKNASPSIRAASPVTKTASPATKAASPKIQTASSVAKTGSIRSKSASQTGEAKAGSAVLEASGQHPVNAATPDDVHSTREVSAKNLSKPGSPIKGPKSPSPTAFFTAPDHGIHAWRSSVTPPSRASSPSIKSIKTPVQFETTPVLPGELPRDASSRGESARAPSKAASSRLGSVRAASVKPSVRSIQGSPVAPSGKGSKSGSVRAASVAKTVASGESGDGSTSDGTEEEEDNVNVRLKVLIRQMKAAKNQPSAALTEAKDTPKGEPAGEAVAAAANPAQEAPAAGDGDGDHAKSVGAAVEPEKAKSESGEPPAVEVGAEAEQNSEGKTQAGQTAAVQPLADPDGEAELKDTVSVAPPGPGSPAAAQNDHQPESDGVKPSTSEGNRALDASEEPKAAAGDNASEAQAKTLAAEGGGPSQVPHEPKAEEEDKSPEAQEEPKAKPPSQAPIGSPQPRSPGSPGSTVYHHTPESPLPTRGLGAAASEIAREEAAGFEASPSITNEYIASLYNLVNRVDPAPEPIPEEKPEEASEEKPEKASEEKPEGELEKNPKGESEDEPAEKPASDDGHGTVYGTPPTGDGKEFPRDIPPTPVSKGDHAKEKAEAEAAAKAGADAAAAQVEAKAGADAAAAQVEATAAANVAQAEAEARAVADLAQAEADAKQAADLAQAEAEAKKAADLAQAEAEAKKAAKEAEAKAKAEKESKAKAEAEAKAAEAAEAKKAAQAKMLSETHISVQAMGKAMEAILQSLMSEKANKAKEQDELKMLDAARAEALAAHQQATVELLQKEREANAALVHSLNAKLSELQQMQDEERTQRLARSAERDPTAAIEALTRIVNDNNQIHANQFNVTNQSVQKLMNDMLQAQHTHHNEVIHAVSAAGGDYAQSMAQATAADMKRILGKEVLRMFEEVGRIRESKRSLEHELGELFQLRAKYGKGMPPKGAGKPAPSAPMSDPKPPGSPPKPNPPPSPPKPSASSAGPPSRRPHLPVPPGSAAGGH